MTFATSPLACYGFLFLSWHTTMKMFRLLPLMLACFAASAHATDTCPMLESAAVKAAFHTPSAHLISADPSGICTWMMPNGGTLVAQVHKRASAAEAKILYKSYQDSIFSGLTRGLAHPAIGQQAVMGLSVQNYTPGQGGLMVQDQDTLLVLSYYLHQAEGLDEPVLTALESLGHQAFKQRGAADQSYGSCEWFSTDSAQELLGKGKLTIQRLGPNHCIASMLPAASSLAVMTDKATTERALANMQESAREGCTVAPIPEFGANAFVAYACPAPGDQAMTIQFLRNGTHAQVGYNPGTRASTQRDVQQLLPIARQAFGNL